MDDFGTHDKQIGKSGSARGGLLSRWDTRETLSHSSGRTVRNSLNFFLRWTACSGKFIKIAKKTKSNFFYINKIILYYDNFINIIIVLLIYLLSYYTVELSILSYSWDRTSAGLALLTQLQNEKLINWSIKNFNNVSQKMCKNNSDEEINFSGVSSSV